MNEMPRLSPLPEPNWLKELSKPQKTVVKVTLDDWQHFDRVLEQLDKDIAREPDNNQLKYNKGAWLLSNGRFTEGWKNLWHRIGLAGNVANYTQFPIPVWDGEDLTGKHVFVWLEQGIGDQILTASMLTDLRKVCGAVTVYCNRRLVKILRRSLADIEVLGPIDLGDDFTKYDFQLAFPEVGEITRKDWCDFGKRASFLKADPELTAKMRAKYQGIKPGNKVIGISWRSISPKTGTGKTIELKDLGPILDLPGYTFVSLQYAETAEELADTRLYRDTSFDQMSDIESFAAQIAACDKVVSISVSGLHLAGALGVKSLGMLPRGGARNWYWFNEREDSPWYPSVSLTRQTETGNWSGPIVKARKFIKYG